MSAIESGYDQTVKFASFSDATGDRNEVVAAQGTAPGTTHKIRVLGYVLNAAGGANTVTWETGTTALSGAMDMANNATIEIESDYGLFETTTGAALNLSMTAATLVAGHVAYVLI